MADAPVRIVQISDTHLYGDQEKSLLGVNTQESFAAVLDHVKKHKHQPDLILLTGDMSQDSSEISYRHLAEQMKDFPVPVYYVAGNHDNTKVMTKVYPLENITHHRHIVLKHWHLILLDSHKPNAVEGFLEPSQLMFLEHCIEMYPEHHAIVVLHHQPVPVGSTWLDRLGLTNAAELWHRLIHFPKMHTILFGHVHQEHQGKKDGIAYYSVPSTCIQFKTGSHEFALEELPPGYRWIELYPNGKLVTAVERVPHYVGHFDKEAKGY